MNALITTGWSLILRAYNVCAALGARIAAYVFHVLERAYDASVHAAGTTLSWVNTARTSVAAFIAPKVLA